MKVPSAARWLLPALLSGVLAVAWMGQTDFVPAGPTATEPGFGPGSDWDLQWSTLEAGRSAAAHGSLAHWDPFPDYGAPVLAHPESFVAHPAWLLGARGDGASGLHLLYGSALMALFLGFAWLATELSIPWFVGTVAAAAVVASFEWEQRLYSGHLMFLGTTWWPAAVAGVLRAMKENTSPLWAGLGGAAIGLGSLGGGHYPTLFGGVLLALLIWAHGARLRWQLSFLGLSLVGMVSVGPESARWVISAAAAGVLLAGAFRAEQGRRLATIAVCTVAGLVGVAGFRLLPGLLLAREVGRVDAAGIGRLYEAVPFSSVLMFSGEFEGTLHLASPVVGLALLVGVLLLGVRHAESHKLVVPVAALTFIAWGSGGPGTLWPLLHLAPGLTGVNYPLRLQWVFLYFGPFALGWLVWLESRRLPHYRTMILGSVALGVSCWLLAGAPLEDRAPDSRDRTVAESRVVGVLDEAEPARHLGLASRDGLIREGQATAMGFAAPSEVFDLTGVEIAGSRVSIDGSPGTTVMVPQRYLPGWSCVGGSVGDPDPARLLAVTLNHGRATCEFRSPGLRFGMALQVLAWLVLVGVGRRFRRGGPKAESLGVQ